MTKQEVIAVKIENPVTWKTPLNLCWKIVKLLIAIWLAALIVKWYTWSYEDEDGNTVFRKGYFDFGPVHFAIGAAVVLPFLLVLYICARICEDPRHCLCGPSGKEKKIKRDKGSSSAQPTGPTIALLQVAGQPPSFNHV